jgi:protein SCO1
MTAKAFAAAAALLLAAPALAGAAGAPDRVEKQRRYFGNAVLVDQDGREVRFFDDVLRDQVVVIDFVFTRCTGACPLLTRKLAQVKAELGGALGRGVRFASISVDPAHDRPAQLRAFAERHGAAGEGWAFLTGDPAAVDGVVKRLGQYVEAPEDHSTVFIVGNARTNHWMRARPDSPAAVLAEQIRLLLAEDPAAAPQARN